jgi:hypothetical protein
MDQPNQQSAQPKKKSGCLTYTGMGCLVILGFFLLFVGYSCVAGVAGLDKAKEKAQQKQKEQDAQQALENTNSAVTATEEAQEPMVFDLEALYGKNIDEIRTTLGEPIDTQLDPTSLQTEVGISEWNNTFEKDEYTLLVTYDNNTRKVIDFFIPTNDPSGATKDVGILKAVGNVNDTTQYTVEPIHALTDPSSYTGLKVTPKK